MTQLYFIIFVLLSIIACKGKEDKQPPPAIPLPHVQVMPPGQLDKEPWNTKYFQLEDGTEAVILTAGAASATSLSADLLIVMCVNDSIMAFVRPLVAIIEPTLLVTVHIRYDAGTERALLLPRVRLPHVRNPYGGVLQLPYSELDRVLAARLMHVMVISEDFRLGPIPVHGLSEQLLRNAYLCGLE